MKIYSIIVLLILAISSVEAFEYQEQTLQPLTPSDTQPQRLFAPKRKAYPFLDQLESLLYPNKNFKREAPGQRLERLELAVFGNKQSGNISTRLNNLQSELNNWQIGNMQVVKNHEVGNCKVNGQGSTVNGSDKYGSTISTPFTVHHSPLTSQPYHSPQAIQKDYDHMNYRLVTPLVQNIGRRAIDAIFH